MAFEPGGHGLGLTEQVPAQSAGELGQGTAGGLQHAPFVGIDQDLAAGPGQQDAAVAVRIGLGVRRAEAVAAHQVQHDLVDDERAELFGQVQGQARAVFVVGVQQPDRRFQAIRSRGGDGFGQDQGTGPRLKVGRAAAPSRPMISCLVPASGSMVV